MSFEASDLASDSVCDSSVENSFSTVQLQQLESAGDTFYGQVILLGYNGQAEGIRYNNNGRKHLSKMFFKRRDEPNGIKKASVVRINTPANQAKAVRDSSRHTVSYSYGKSGTVLVEYVSEPSKDMFQIGRSSEEQIDFTIVDTWLAAGANSISSPPPGGNNSNSARHHQLREGEAQNGQKPIASTISRYACRILAERNPPNSAFIYAAGFNASRNIFLGEKATKWQKKNGEFDGLTTNGVLILHPDWSVEVTQPEQENETKPKEGEMYVWREVSVDGDIYTLRETRSSMQRGEVVHAETNQLQDGTLIDLCGATLLWRSVDGLKQSPSKLELERRLDELNAGKPQCPVNLNTLVIPRKKHSKSNSSSRQPYVYIRCGHVQGKHSWGVNKNGGTIPTYRCPICLGDSERVIQLVMGMESAFHLDSGSLDYAFNPCGHMASQRTVRYWSRIPLPHGTNSFHPVCPFCTSLLSTEKPFVKLIFQDHCYDFEVN